MVAGAEATAGTVAAAVAADVATRTAALAGVATQPLDSGARAKAKAEAANDPRRAGGAEGGGVLGIAEKKYSGLSPAEAAQQTAEAARRGEAHRWARRASTCIRRSLS